MTAEAGGPNTEAARILVVEDDPEIRALMLRYLEAAGYKVAAVPDGLGMDALMAKQPIDLVLLDLMLQHETGFDLCRRIRVTSDARIIMVTALSSVADRVVGLDLGADDYIGKPFELAELGARIRAVLRRGGDPSDGLHFAGWRFEPERRALFSARGVRMMLTGAETDLLLAFSRHPHEVLGRAQLITLMRGSGELIAERTIDLLVSRMRRKLAQGGRQLELIRTVRSDGYVFDPDLSGRGKSASTID
jgi:two-component system OmpR family response regulator